MAKAKKKKRPAKKRRLPTMKSADKSREALGALEKDMDGRMRGVVAPTTSGDEIPPPPPPPPPAPPPFPPFLGF